MNSNIRQLTVLEMNNLAVPLVNNTIGRYSKHPVGEFDGDQDDLVDFWGYFRKENLVGVIGLGGSLPGINRRYLGYFAVDEKARRRGVGRKLFDFLEREIKRRKIREIVVETYASCYFAPARRFYVYMGFIPVGTLRNFLESGVDAIFYSKRYED